jgi:hypothetical protein
MDTRRQPHSAAGRARPGGNKTPTDATDDAPDPGRSAEREAQEHVIDHAARDESWLKQIWRAWRGSAGRPSTRS